MSNELTYAQASKRLRELQYAKAQMGQLSINDEIHKRALEVALPILDQQERGEVVENNLKHVGYLFVNAGGGVVYSPSGYGMRGYTCAGKIYGDVNLQQERGEGEWIEWGGGERPAHGLVEFEMRDGDKDTSLGASLDWSHEFRCDDIIAYRIIPEQPTNQNGEQ